MSLIPDSPLAGVVKELPDDRIESLKPVVLVSGARRNPVGRIQNGDYVIFFNLRGEREIELTQAFVDDELPDFSRDKGFETHWVTMVDYDSSLDVRVAYGRNRHEDENMLDDRGVVRDTLSETISRAGLCQVKISELGKQKHVGFFLNGKKDQPFDREKWEVIECPEYLHAMPDMCAHLVTDAAIKAWKVDRFDFIVVNYANVDVIGHKGNAENAKIAVSAVDAQLGRAIRSAREAGVVCVVTADHGTVEKWFYSDEEDEVDDGHTNSPVPFVLVPPSGSAPGNSGAAYLCRRLQKAVLRKDGTLIDVAPTVLQLLGLEKPAAMRGTSLIEGEVELEGLDRPRVALFILDGWGVGNQGSGDLVAKADTPVMDRLQREYPAACLAAAGKDVGLPGKMRRDDDAWVGNSEVGHLHIGAGRVIESDRVRINEELDNGKFFENEALLGAMSGAKRDRTRLHLLGLVSMYSSHGSLLYLWALLEMAKRLEVPEVYLHGILTKRGERRKDIDSYVGMIEAECARLGVGQLVGLIGRDLALDREENWDRIEETFRWLVYGEGTPA